MKKALLFLCAVVCVLSSCSTISKTSSSRNINAPLAAAVISDLDVSGQKISYTYTPPKSVRRGGLNNCINSAIREALAKNGDFDVLVETQQELVIYRGIFVKKVQTITVTGYPAKYKNFRSADEATVKAGIVSGALGAQNPSNGNYVNRIKLF